MHPKFDYKKLAKTFETQSKNLIPSDIREKDKSYIQNLLYNFCLLAGEALVNDKECNFDNEQKVFIVQIIAEWCFHKSVDMIRANVPSQHWDNILQKIAFTIFEITKQALKKSIEQTQTLKAVEYHVNKVYKEYITELLEKNEIDNAIYNKAIIESNIDKMVLYEVTKRNERTTQDLNNKTNTKEVFQLKNIYRKISTNIDKTAEMLKKQTINCLLFIKDTIEMFIAFIYFYLKQKTNRILIYLIFITIGIFNVYTNKIMELAQQFNIELSTIKIALYIIIVLVILKTIIKTMMTAVNADVQEHLNKLEETKQNLKELTNPDNQFDRLGVDILSLGVGRNLIQITDPDQDGELLARTIALRQRLTDTLGYIIPNIRIMDACKLELNEFRIYVRQEIVATGYVYPDRIMVLEKELQTHNLQIPKNPITGVCYSTQEPCYWVEKHEIDREKIKAYKPEEVIINTIEEVVIKEVDTILSSYDVEKYLNKAKETEYAKTQIDTLLKQIQTNDIRKVFANLIREKISIKDLLFILDRLSDYSRNEKNPNILSEQIRADLARHISLKHADENLVLHALTLAKELENNLGKILQENETGEVYLITPSIYEELAKNVIKTFEIATNRLGKQPIILCSSKIRLPLYTILSIHIPSISVVAYSELINEVKVEVIDTIK